MRLLPALILALLPLPCSALTISYDVRTPRPTNHQFEISVELRDVQGESVDLAMPAWTPGYYKIQDHARNVRGFSAACPDDGTPLEFRKTDKQTWRIGTAGRKNVIATYRVFAHQLSATGADLTDEHAYFHGAWIFMYVVGSVGEPVTLRLHPLPGWKTATGLEPGPDADTWTAADYDVLIDCPVEMGAFDMPEFQAGGVTHRVMIHGEPRCDVKAMVEDIRKIVDAQIAIFGPPPYRHYTFLLHFPRWGSGGLEHLNSTSIVVNGEEQGDRNRYLRFLFIVSHEFFHLWNVKRIRPEQLGPFDYTKEVLTRNLWVHEGFTTYYGWLAMQRAGVIDRKQYAGFVEEDVRNLLSRTGRKVTSPEMASWDTWLGPDDPENIEVSYYTSGHLLGLLLDIEIRRRSGGAKSLDDVMRLSWEKSKTRGYPGDDFLAIVNEASGGDFAEFFRKYVSGTDEFPYAAVLPAAGLQYEAKDEGAESDPGFETHGLAEDLVRISRVHDDSPAGEAGFDAGDILLAAEGKRLRAGTFWNFVHSKKPGEKIAFLIFRGERAFEKTVTLRERRKVTHFVRLVEKPDEAQKKLQDGWLK
ncbi:MAG: M61 family metallopeptidase [Planctomycetes bacterium]|nr:M61 family metallopeptidase [Planctomycetota bacterium]